MVHDRSQFRRLKPYVEGHNDAAGQRYAIVAFQKLVRIEAEVRDAIPRLESLCQKSSGESFAAFAELSVSETAVTGDDSCLSGVEINRSIEEADRRQRDIHRQAQMDC